MLFCWAPVSRLVRCRFSTGPGPRRAPPPVHGACHPRTDGGTGTNAGDRSHPSGDALRVLALWLGGGCVVLNGLDRRVLKLFFDLIGSDRLDFGVVFVDLDLGDGVFDL